MLFIYLHLYIEKMRLKNPRRTFDNILASFLILTLEEDLEERCLSGIVEMILNNPDPNSPNISYCLLTGNKDTMSRIVDRIQSCYIINWIGEYCIVSYRSTFSRFVPVADVNTLPIYTLEISIRGLRILYSPYVILPIYIETFINLTGFDLIISCNMLHDENRCRCPGWSHGCDHEKNNYGLHYYSNNKSESSEAFDDLVTRYFKGDGFTFCFLNIPNLLNEKLESSFGIQTATVLENNSKVI
jgi:hypothetical protein